MNQKHGFYIDAKCTASAGPPEPDKPLYVCCGGALFELRILGGMLSVRAREGAIMVQPNTTADVLIGNCKR